MENTKKPSPILGFDEIFDKGIIVDGTGADLDEVDRIMREYLDLTPLEV